MTTIAADFASGVMVSDSKCTDGTTWFPCTKIHRIGGELVGLCGSVRESEKWLKWHRSGRKRAMPKLETFGGLILRADGLYELSSDGLEMRMERGFHACGSGTHAALAVLLMGGDPIKAVEVACEIDQGSGGEIQVFNIKDAA